MPYISAITGHSVIVATAYLRCNFIVIEDMGGKRQNEKYQKEKRRRRQTRYSYMEGFLVFFRGS